MLVIRSTSADDEGLAVFRDLTNHQLRNAVDPERGIMICESEIVVRVALDRADVLGIRPISFLLDENKLEALGPDLADLPDDVPVYVLPHDEAARITGYRVTRGVLAAFTRPAPVSPEELVVGTRRVAVLEGIVDTTNVGAIFRSAAALGVDAVLLAPTCADPLSRRSIRVSMGNVLNVPWARFAAGEWPEGALGKLRNAGFTCAALALSDDSVPLDDPSLANVERLAMLFGTEGDGLTRSAIEGSDIVVRIPMAHGVDSLNVAAASAVTFWQLCR
ncbi:MAG: RNA methyltransferase [Atopobiaceae bacterium]|nr:RNA methyltransferase [Atopobiaceae bacterium]